MTLEPAARAALQSLVQVLGRDRFVVIGALVPIVLIDLRYGATGGRTTRDIDAVVRAESWDEFEAHKARLVEAGFRRGAMPHRLHYGEAQLDLIPFSQALAPAGRLEWPGEDRAMSTLGLEEAFACARVEPIDDVAVPMMTVAGSVLLKLVAYTDRPGERVRDLRDVVRCFEHYGDHPDDLRFEVAAVEVDGEIVTYEDAGAYLLGQEVARLAKPATLALVRRLAGSIADEYAHPIRQLLAEEHRHVDAEDRARSLLRLFRVFAAGIDASR